MVCDRLQQRKRVAAGSMQGDSSTFIGARYVQGTGVQFRVWAPKRRRVEVVFDATGNVVPLAREAQHYFGGIAPRAEPGMRYRYRLDDEVRLYPDPASRFQPDGPHGPSEIVDATGFAWRHDGWPGLPPPEHRVLYELHIGTFTPAGTWAGAAEELEELARLGINVVEVMPVADFAGSFGWGYDGVNLFAPTRLYGRPDDFRRFVDRAHGAGIGVVLDVVYNHFGPEGCYLRAYSDDYFSARYENEWGEPLNFDDEHAAPTRAHIVANAAYWIEAYHLDGLRIDATQQMFDASPRHIVADVVAAARRAAPERRLMIVCENEPQDANYVRGTQQGGHGADALWNDDFHHSASVALTGHAEAYYSDYAGTAQELLASLTRGFLYQGQFSRWQKKRRGAPAHDLLPSAFVHYLENHDQAANSAFGRRLAQRTSPGRLRAMTAVLLLGPQLPMLFQGQEFASTRPFLFFADHAGEIAASVRRGRARFLAQFPSIATPSIGALLPDPADRTTFERCKLDLSERCAHGPIYMLHRDLLRLRKTDPIFGRARTRPIDGCVLSPHAFALRYALGEERDRLLLVNLGRDLTLAFAPDPVLAPPDSRGWRLLWSSEDPRYGGEGTADIERPDRFFIPGEAAVVLAEASPIEPPPSIRQ